MYKTINIDADIHKKLKLYGAERGLSITELVEDAVSVYLDPYTKDKLLTPQVLKNEYPSTSEPLPLEEAPEHDELDELREKYPNIKLFGKTRACPFCSQQIPVELAQKHYDEKHEGS